MFRYHTDEEIRRYDLMKLGVLLLLLLLLALAWFATRGETTSGQPGVEAATPVADETTGDTTSPMPTLRVPAINVPDTSPPAGNVPLSGTAEPGSQVVVLINDQPATAAITGVDGAWSASIILPAGDYTVKVQTVDNLGNVVSESQPATISVGSETSAEAPGGFSPPGFDPVTGDYIFSGTVAPGSTVTVSSNGTVVGSAVADESGNFIITVPAEAITGEVQIEVIDPAGNVVQQSEPYKLNARPPSLNLSPDAIIDPGTGAVSVPTTPTGIVLNGSGEPGTQVELLVNGESGGSAVVDAGGAWSLPLNLPAGTYTVQLDTLDPGGALLSSADPVVIVVGGGTPQAGTPSGEPPAEQTIAGVLAARPEFSTLLSVLQTAGVVDKLNEPGPFTAFAPTNDAFAQLPQRVIDGLRANPQALSEVLQYHIALGRYLASDLAVVQPATVNGRLLTVSRQGDLKLVNDAVVTETDIMATNGVIHAIDRILVPPLAEGVRPPIIDSSGVATFTGTFLTIVGTGEPNRTILVELNGEAFGQPVVVSPEGTWSVSGDVTPGEYQIVAYMLDTNESLLGIARPVTLLVQ